MKKIKLLALTLCIGSFIFITESCKKTEPDDKCDVIECNTGSQNAETCECDCPTGFSGTNCEIEDKCVSQNVVCENGGTCDDGICDCPDGFIGTNCENIDPTKIQQLLNSGTNPKVLFDGGIPLADLYGKTYEGGLIFYVNTTDGTGLIAAADDEVSSYEYGCFGTATSATGTAIGTGEANTTSITSACTMGSVAAKQCADAVMGGKSDWYLGSLDEMTEMFNNLADSDGDGMNTGTMDANNLGGLANGTYWTSSEADMNTASNVNMADGTDNAVGKGFSNRVRAIRSFQ